MAKHRLLNCEYVLAGSFKVNLSNKAKLLYFLMFASADDKGFVDNTNDLIISLEENDKNLGNELGLTLLNNDYQSALNELKDKGLIYEFEDNHYNKVHLIRHWFYHNKFVKGLWTNYQNFLSKVYLSGNEYLLGKKPFKEDKLKENNLNQDKLNYDNEIVEEPTPQPKQEMSEEDFNSLSKEEQKKAIDEELPF